MIQIPASVPFVVAGTQVGVAYSVAGAMIGEWVGATKGLGARMLAANSLLRTDLVFAAILVLSLMALVLFVLVMAAGRLVTPWRRVQGHG
jgi:NitT/TauT family transport system permease protein